MFNNAETKIMSCLLGQGFQASEAADFHEANTGLGLRVTYLQKPLGLNPMLHVSEGWGGPKILERQLPTWRDLLQPTYNLLRGSRE